MKKQYKKTIRVFFLCLFAVIFLISAGILVCRFMNNKNKEDKFQEIKQEAKKEKPKKAEPEIDFKKLRETNSDIYAWIKIPNTIVDYPVLMSDEEKDTDYYLEYNLDHSKGRPGCLYVEKEQAKDFSDFNTIIYGHNMYTTKTMFNALVEFQNQDFFDNNDKFVIETEEARRTYKIYCAVKRDDMHLLYYYNFKEERGRKQYISDLIKSADESPDVSHIRSDLSIDVKKDKLVTLSTCMTRDNTHRYLVVGILVDEKKFL